MIITRKEKIGALARYCWLIFLWFLVWFFGFISGSVIVAHYLKHVLDVKMKFWLLNDTVDGDYGEEEWLDNKGYEPGLWSAFCWWWRNKAWNFLNRTKPHWAGGKADSFRTVKNTIVKLVDGRWTKANKKHKIYGLNFFFFRLKGKVFFNFSYANKFIEVQFGAGGNEWRCWVKF